jgi:glc operon protein GlcG
MRKAVGTLLAMVALAGPAGAQTARPMLDYASAAKIRDGCVAWASERKLAVAVVVYDERGTMLAFALMDGAATAVGDYAQWKGRSAATIHVASAETANWGRGPAQLATWEGGTPVFSADKVPLGGVGVSGAESAEDVACGKAGIAAAGLKDSKD